MSAKVQIISESDKTRRGVGVESELVRFCEVLIYKLTISARQRVNSY